MKAEIKIFTTICIIFLTLCIINNTLCADINTTSNGGLMMNKIEKIYRRRKQLLICALVCSFILFLALSFWPSLLIHLRLSGDWVLGTLKISGVLAIVLLLFLFTRYVLFRAATLKDPALRKAVDDERIRRSWLKAYRAAFFVMVGIHVLFLLPFIGPAIMGIGIPQAPWVSSTTGLMTLFGAAVLFSREM